jgi:acyl CoA:acetate/3-ketoacid CoA transferase beta subunit
MAAIEITAEGLVLKELAEGVSLEQVQALTEPRLIVQGEIAKMA